MKPLTPNTMIQNRYLIVQPIGKGGMGDVYLAVDQRLGSAVALKRTFFADDNALGTAFEREARILGRLRHPVLPKVIDHFAENGDQYLVMEHISGDDLSKRLEGQNKPFPLTWVMFWADQLLDALSYLHTHEPPIIHRDIKPQNLKLTDENHIVLLDFGLSKDFDSSKPGNGMNSASVAGYSPHFAAMEQIRGTGTDGRSDLFSLSATLYQLLTNSIPSEALTRADAMLGGKPDPIVPLNELNPEVPVAVSDVILKGIALRQNERYTTASEMQRALRRAYNRGQAETPAPQAEKLPEVRQTAPAAVEVRQEPEALVENFDATIKVDDIAAAPARQADVKTAVMSAADLRTKEDLPAAPTTQGRADEINRPPESENGAIGNGVAAGAPTQSVVTKASSRPATTASKSRSGLFVAGILGILVIGAVAAGGGWYAYKNYYSAGAPKAEPISSPTPEPVRAAEPLSNSDPTAGLTNTNSTPGSNSVSANSDQASSAAPTGSKPTASGPKPNPGRSEKAPAPKAPAKPGQKDDRTVILQ